MRVVLDEDTLQKIAGITHGEYYAATSTQQLKRIYEHLSARMVIERSRTVEVTAVGRPQKVRVVVDSVEVNPTIADARFARPATP